MLSTTDTMKLDPSQLRDIQLKRFPHHPFKLTPIYSPSKRIPSFQVFCLYFIFHLYYIIFVGNEKMDGGNALTPLQKHVAFFDRNKDGIVYPWETFQGFRAIGCGLPLSIFAAAFINGFLGPKTRKGIIPSPLFPIYVKNIKKGKHGSDTNVYDSEGRFVPEKFEEIFKKHAHTHPDALTSAELKEMLKANREPKDYGGWLGAYTEWMILYYLCKDKNGLLHKDTIRAVYDGSLFLQMENERTSSQKNE